MWDDWYSDLNGILIIAEITSNDSLHGTKLPPNSPAHENRSSNSDTSKVVGVSHAYICPKRNQLWLEGIRINPKYRRMGIASHLIDRMIEFGRGHDSNIREVAAITSETNVASSSMLEKNEFQKKARWTYYTWQKAIVNGKKRKRLATEKYIFKEYEGYVPNKDTNIYCGNMDVSFASIDDVQDVITFLSRSKSFTSAGIDIK